MALKVRIVGGMRITEVTPEWIRMRARTRGMSQADLAKAIGMERTKISKSLNGHRNFLAWELEKIVQVLGEAEALATVDPEVNQLVADYLALGEADRARARALLRALLSAAAREENPPGTSDPEH